jgi:mono/diheme cytochrome c family protein
MKPLCSLLILAGLLRLAAGPGRAEEPRPHPLRWDALEKTVEAARGDQAAEFVFNVTNVSDHAVTITSVRPSCGCTVVALPAIPWVLAPGAGGRLPATVDFTGKDGTLTKSLYVETSAGPQELTMTIKLPPPDQNARLNNQAMARANRQAIFRGSCVQCHVIPAVGKTGEELFRTACVICHTPAGRASMVPDLFTARSHRDAAWWRDWITHGRDGSLMPAFGKPSGILSEPEIESLVEFALSHLPTEPRTN